MNERSGGCGRVFGEGERRDPDYIKKRSVKWVKFDLVCGNPEHGICPDCWEPYRELRDAVKVKPLVAMEIIKREDFVFDGSGGRWEKLAFSFYSDLCHLADVHVGAIKQRENEECET